MPFEQVPLALVAAHGWLQAPHCGWLVWMFVSQPSGTRLLQLAYGIVQVAIPHTPAAQLGVPLVTEQTLPHIPQSVIEVALLKPSSTTPSQLSSFSLQVSTPASPGLQVPATPSAQLSTVRLHSPV